MQQKAPGCLQHGVEGDFLPTGELGQTLGCAAVEGDAIRFAALGAYRWTQGFGQQGRG
ncbi:hypothetical protein D3C84_1215590 [compost metagenome]